MEIKDPGGEELTCVILAGGRGRRMGGADKGLIRFRGRPLVEHVIERVRPQVDRIVISANRNLLQYGIYGYPVIPDASGNFDGPLAGVLSVMRAVTRGLLLTVPCDAPFLPADLAARLRVALAGADVDACLVHDGQRLQPVCALLRVSLAQNLAGYLAAGRREMGRWLAETGAVSVDFSDEPQAFSNINTLQDLRWPGER